MGYCGHEEYFAAIGDIECEAGQHGAAVCQVGRYVDIYIYYIYISTQDLLLGDQCCHDLSSPSLGRIPRRCCSHQAGVIPPSQNLGDQEIQQVCQLVLSCSQTSLIHSYCSLTP